jgi:uncharacterized protein YxeA
MYELLIVVIKSLPPWFIMLLVAVLVLTALYYLPKIRRDKHGKLYVFSRSYEYQKNRMKEHKSAVSELQRALDDAIDKQGASLARIETRVKSVELEDLKQSFYLELLPKDERLISGLKYVYAGGNGAVRGDIAKFVKEYPDVYADVILRFPQWALDGGREE